MTGIRIVTWIFGDNWSAPLPQIAEGPTFADHSIGYAWHINPHGVRSHSGGTGGFSATIAVNRAQRTAAVVMADSIASFDDLALHLVDPAYPLRRKYAFLPRMQAMRENRLADAPIRVTMP